MENAPLRRAYAGILLAAALYGAPRRAAALAAKGRPATRRQSDPAPKPRRRRATEPSVPPLSKRRLFGLDVADVMLDEAVARIIAWSREVPARTVATAHMGHAIALRRDRVFARAMGEADLVLGGARPFLWVSGDEGGELRSLIRGEDLVEPLAAEAARAGRSLFLFGPTMSGLHQVAKGLKRRHPRLELVGAYAPPDGFERDPEVHREILSMIRTARPDIILVAMAAPDGEVWANGMADAVRHGVFVTVGRDLGTARTGSGALTTLFALPSLYVAHRADRAEHGAAERRRAIAATSDERYRATRAGTRQRELDEAASDRARREAGRR